MNGVDRERQEAHKPRGDVLGLRNISIAQRLEQRDTCRLVIDTQSTFEVKAVHAREQPRPSSGGGICGLVADGEDAVDVVREERAVVTSVLVHKPQDLSTPDADPVHRSDDRVRDVGKSETR